MDTNFDFKIIKEKAEGIIHEGIYLKRRVIVKKRFLKIYGHRELDETLPKTGIKIENRAIIRRKETGMYTTPAMYLVDLKRRCMYMKEIENSVTGKDYINTLKSSDQSDDTEEQIDTLAREIGRSVSKMHINGIIHGDLTTYNILVKEENKIYFIDFGFTYFCTTAEDKAVDLYVLERALLSIHENSEELFSKILHSYQCSNKKSSEVIAKLQEIRARDRKRTMIG